MVKESLNGLMAVFMKVNFEITCLMVKEPTFGQMEENMLGIGKILRCMAKESTTGQMVDDTKVNTWRISKKATEYSSGRMDKNTKGIGKRVLNMGKVL